MLAVTKVYDPSIIRIAAVFAIVLSMFGKFGAFVRTIPGPVMGGISIVLFGMIASVGLRILINAKLDFSHSPAGALYPGGKWPGLSAHPQHHPRAVGADGGFLLRIEAVHAAGSAVGHGRG